MPIYWLAKTRNGHNCLRPFDCSNAFVICEWVLIHLKSKERAKKKIYIFKCFVTFWCTSSWLVRLNWLSRAAPVRCSDVKCRTRKFWFNWECRYEIISPMLMIAISVLKTTNSNSGKNQCGAKSPGRFNFRTECCFFSISILIVVAQIENNKIHFTNAGMAILHANRVYFSSAVLRIECNFPHGVFGMGCLRAKFVFRCSTWAAFKLH